MNYLTSIFAATMTALAASSVSAASIVVPFTGSYDEAAGTEASGDYDNIGGLQDTGRFNLVGGSNVFEGSIFTPTDSSDFFTIGLSEFQTLTSVTVLFGSNLDPFNPLFAAPAPVFNLSSTSGVDEIVNRSAGTDGQTSGSSFTETFSRGEGEYAVLFGNGTFAPNNGGPVDYTLTFSVTDNTPPPPSAVPVPPALPLLGAGVLMLGWISRRKRS